MLNFCAFFFTKTKKGEISSQILNNVAFSSQKLANIDFTKKQRIKSQFVLKCPSHYSHLLVVGFILLLRLGRVHIVNKRLVGHVGHLAVTLLVTLQVLHQLEFGTAQVAAKRAIIRVDSLMAVQMSRGDERLVAHITPIVQLASMPLHVCPKAALVAEGIGADGAPERWFRGMGPLVRYQRRPVAEAGPADFAHQESFPGVQPPVNLHVALLLETVAAKVAPVLAHTQVHSFDVGLQGTAQLELAATLFTSEWPLFRVAGVVQAHARHQRRRVIARVALKMSLVVDYQLRYVEHRGSLGECLGCGILQFLGLLAAATNFTADGFCRSRIPRSCGYTLLQMTAEVTAYTRWPYTRVGAQIALVVMIPVHRRRQFIQLIGSRGR